mgnify:CR=1 FL=1
MSVAGCASLQRPEPQASSLDAKNPQGRSIPQRRDLVARSLAEKRLVEKASATRSSTV